MRRSQHPRHTTQLDLFHPPLRAPEWRRLPAEVRERTALLLARMLRDAETLADDTEEGRENE